MGPTNQGEGGKELAKLSQVIQIDEGEIPAHLGEVVRSTLCAGFARLILTLPEAKMRFTRNSGD
jgi:hypothetical protein